MVYAIIGGNCSGESTPAAAPARRTGAEISTVRGLSPHGRIQSRGGFPVPRQAGARRSPLQNPMQQP